MNNFNLFQRWIFSLQKGNPMKGIAGEIAYFGAIHY
jgi:hypothetical protein